MVTQGIDLTGVNL